MAQVLCNLHAADQWLAFLSQGSKEAREQQERLLQAVEERRALRETAVPTSDADVHAALRAIGEPVTLFGEQQVHLPLLHVQPACLWQWSP